MGRGSVLRTAQSSPRTVLPCTLSLFSLLFSLSLSFLPSPSSAPPSQQWVSNAPGLSFPPRTHKAHHSEPQPGASFVKYAGGFGGDEVTWGGAPLSILFLSSSRAGRPLCGPVVRPGRSQKPGAGQISRKLEGRGAENCREEKGGERRGSRVGEGP